MKNCSLLCGVLDRDILALMGVGIFISTHTERRNLGLPTPNGFCTVRSEIVPVKNRGSAALFLYPYYNFSFMTGTMKNCVSAQGASNAASAHETGDLFDQLIQEVKSLIKQIETEKDAKNEAYAYILSSGLLPDFIKHSRTYSGEADSVSGRISLILKNC